MKLSLFRWGEISTVSMKWKCYYFDERLKNFDLNRPFLGYKILVPIFQITFLSQFHGFDFFFEILYTTDRSPISHIFDFFENPSFRQVFRLRNLNAIKWHAKCLCLTDSFFSFLWFGVVYVVRLIGADTVPARRQNKNLHFWNYATPKDGGIANAPSRRVVTHGGSLARTAGDNLRSFVFVTKPQPKLWTRYN